MRYAIGDWLFAARECRNGAPGFVAWGNRSGVMPVDPFGDDCDVWFQFGESADAAMAALAREVGVAV